MILIGKTNISKFGLGSHSNNTIFGTSSNAFDPSRSAGDSSGGTAVALAEGSDMMGLLRIPAG